MAENITYPAYDAMLAGTSVLNTWSDGTQFSIGNTTYAWDPTPGLWRAFTTATSSSGGGGGSEFVSFDPRAVATSTNILTNGGTLTAGENGAYGWFTAFNVNNLTVSVTGDGSVLMPGGNATHRDNARYLPQGFDTSLSLTTGPANQADFVGGMFYLGPNGTITSSGNTFEARMVDIVPVSAGGGGTTVNIGGGSGGLALGTFANQVEGAGTSGTLALDFSGPAWVWLSGGGGGGGARVDMVLDEYAQRGGAAGSGGFFLEDVSVLEGATYTVGARGTGASVTKATNDNEAGTGGGTSTLSWSGITFTCTGGGGGSGSSGTSTAGLPGGTAGQATITGTDAPTLIPQADLLSAAQDAWRNTVVDDGDGNITLAYTEVSFPAAAGGAGQTVMLDQSGIMQETATGAPGGHGTLTIVYQPQ